MTTTTTTIDQKDHVNPLVPEISVSDGVEVPKLPKWVPPWVMTYGNGNIPLSKMTLVDTALQASGAGYLVPEVASRWRDLQTAAQSAGYDLTMTGAYRSLAQQQQLFAARYTTQDTGQEPRTYQGKTYWLKPGNAMVASPGTSNHGWGCAVDMALRINGGVVAVTAPFVGWAAKVAVGLGFSWEDSEPWHIHAIAAGGSNGGTPSAPPSGGGAVTALPQPTLQLGAAGDQVALLQQTCTAHSWGNPGKADGQFGPRTKEAVQELQKAVGLPSDGIYGPHTAAALGQYLKK